MVIPTTAGPLILRKITARPELPASCAFADGDYRPLPWSSDYARLIGPQGPLGRLISGVGTVAYEMRVSGSFDTGRSWEVPTALAHLALSAGDTLTDDPDLAERILWATGAVDLDLAIIPNDYALLEKLHKSSELFARAPDAILDIRLPPGPGLEAALVAARDFLANRTATVRSVTSVMVDRAPDERPVGAVAAPGEKSAGVGWGPLPRGALVLVLAVTALAGGFTAWLLFRPVPAATPIAEAPEISIPGPSQPVTVPSPAEVPATDPRPQSPPIGDAVQPSIPVRPVPKSTISIEEIRAAPGDTCKQLLFGAGRAVATAVSQSDGRFVSTRLDTSLCGLKFKIVEPGKFRLVLSAELLAVTVAGAANARPGETTVFVRDNLKQNVVYSAQLESENSRERVGNPVVHELKAARQ